MRLILTLLISQTLLYGDLEISNFDNLNDFAGSLIDESSYIDPGVEIFNISKTGKNSAFGYFTGGLSAGLGMESGLILSTGKASDASKANIAPHTSTNLRQSGDSQLDALLPGYKTYDATVLEFDFTSTGDSAYFNYAFASEEYTEWVNTAYNDVFGFFIDGENYALIPGTNEPVAINNLNHLEYSGYFNNNDKFHDSGNAQDFALTYDGFTNTFTAQLTGLTPGETYHLKLAIADAGDAVYDSAVFLEAGSFSKTAITPAGAPEPETWLLIIISGMFVYFKFSVERKQEALLID